MKNKDAKQLLASDG